jgi:hypothetical protein
MRGQRLHRNRLPTHAKPAIGSPHLACQSPSPLTQDGAGVAREGLVRRRRAISQLAGRHAAPQPHQPVRAGRERIAAARVHGQRGHVHARHLVDLKGEERGKESKKGLRSGMARHHQTSCIWVATVHERHGAPERWRAVAWGSRDGGLGDDGVLRPCARRAPEAPMRPTVCSSCPALSSYRSRRREVLSVHSSLASALKASLGPRGAFTR